MWKNRMKGDLFNFERGHITGTLSAGASVTKTATWLGVLRASVSKVMSAYTNHGKTTSVKRNSGQKLTERDCHALRTVSKNHRTTAAQMTTELNIHLKDSDVSFRDPTSTVGLQLLNLWSLKVILACINDGAMTIQRGHQTTGNKSVIWSDDSSFVRLSTSERVYIWITPK
jgi:hypothetical protein